MLSLSNFERPSHPEWRPKFVLGPRTDVQKQNVDEFFLNGRDEYQMFFRISDGTRPNTPTNWSKLWRATSFSWFNLSISPAWLNWCQTRRERCSAERYIGWLPQVIIRANARSNSTLRQVECRMNPIKGLTPTLYPSLPSIFSFALLIIIYDCLRIACK